MKLNKVGNPECNPNTWSGYDGDCCTVDEPCGVGEGDCDVDGDCIRGLDCGEDNCGSRFETRADCCFDPGIIYRFPLFNVFADKILALKLRYRNFHFF